MPTRSNRRAAPAILAAAISALPGVGFAQSAAPSAEEMWRIIQAQQSEIDSLRGRLGRTDEKVEAAAQAVERTAVQEPGWWSRTTLGGYGELHYNGGDKDEIDFHRFVLFVGHRFNDRIRLFSELEVEHALSGDGQPGEVELEQAYVEFDLTRQHRAKAGLFLIPVGILNETHEPPTFYGVERNNVEANIIPTTWWEGGAALSGAPGGGFSYDLAVHSGLATPTTGANAFKIRNGRGKVAEAPAEDPAFTARLRWSGMPGVSVGVTGQYQADLTQGATDTDATLIAAHADLRRGWFGLRALYARWDLGGDEPAAIGRDVQEGWYLEPSARTATPLGDVGVFFRFSQWDNEAGNSADSRFTQYDIGVNYWPHPDVVLKADYQFKDAPAGNDDNRLNLGVGFQF